MERDFPVHYKDVSLRLMVVLDTVGLREDLRRKRIEMWIQAEELKSVACGKPIHFFGSQAEATTTPGLQSDIDYVLTFNMLKVIPNLQSCENNQRALLMVSDKDTPPGYVKLQAVYRGKPLTVNREPFQSDRSGRSVLVNNHQKLKFLAPGVEHHGPANTGMLGGNLSMDIVFAMKSTTWPNEASQWLTRSRPHNYPSQETITLIQRCGALLVPVGHQLSPEKHLEWRLSVSYGEKLLVWLFNTTQYKCYVLLKLIKKFFIEPRLGEKALSSYHCKTCVFYVIESTPASFWQPENLLVCVELCLKKLCYWASNGNCPNYFIPEENMFDGKVYGHVQGHLVDIIRDLLGQEARYLLRIPCDDIGLTLSCLCLAPVVELEYDTEEIVKPMMLTIILLWGHIRDAWRDLLAAGVLDNPRILSRACCPYEPRREVDTIIQTFCCSNLGSHLASQCLAQEVIDQERLGIAHELLLLGSSSDLASGKLKLAAFLLFHGNVFTAENILSEIEKNFTYLVTVVPTHPSDEALCRILDENLSTAEMLRQYVAFPVPYLQSEIHCTPKALIPEMFRSTATDSDILDAVRDFWKQQVIVGPKFYLHFLKYQCYLHQNNVLQKMSSLHNMVMVIKNEHFEYKDTALNILAYCLKQEGKLVYAYNILCASMKLKNHHNSAKWKIAALLNINFRLLQQRE